MSTRRVKEIPTSVGLARAEIHRPARGTAERGTLVLGHGAGGSAWSADLRALTGLADEGFVVVLVEQPWRVAGKRVAARPPVLDAAWTEVLAALRRSRLPRPFVVGGRSAGARVACRTAAALGAHAVLALAFPLRPPTPARSAPGAAQSRGVPARPSRVDELLLPGLTGLDVLVVQGLRDPFGAGAAVRAAVRAGSPGAVPSPAVGVVEVVDVPGGHGFGADPTPVVDAVRAWLEGIAPAAGRARE